MKSKKPLLFQVCFIVSLLCTISVFASDGPDPANSANKNTNPSDTTIQAIKELPKFMGLDVKYFGIWVRSNTIYPEQAVREKIEGRVWVSFVIDKDGSLSNIQITSSPHKLLSEEVLRIMNAATGFTPGKKDGVPVRVRYSIFVDFKL